MRHHGDEVVLWLLIDALLPQPFEIHRAFDELFAPCLIGFDDAGFRRGRCDIGPARELAPLLPREIEQGRKGHCGQFDRDLVNPVDILAYRQIIEDMARTFTDCRLK